MKTLFFFACLSVFAADETVYIDQARVTRGNVTPGDAPGFPLTISQPGLYVLTGRLTVPDAMTTAIQITASNVTLDLNGFTISGPVICSGTPLNCSASGSGVGIHAGSFETGVAAPDHVKVMNGYVRGMGFHGVRLMGSGTVVEHVNSSSNGGPGIVTGGDGIVTDCVVQKNGSGSALIASIARGNAVTGNKVNGISLRDGGVATGNAVNFNGNTGISVRYGTVTGNTVNNNGLKGIDATCPAVVTGNTLSGNLGGGLSMTGLCTVAENAQ